MDASLTYAKKYTEDLLSFFGLNVDAEVELDNDVVQINVPSTESNGFLIGSNAETLRSLQTIIGSSLRNKGFEHSRVNLDIAGYKQAREEKLLEGISKTIDKVKQTGESIALAPMNAADRRVVHQAATAAGVKTRSEGEGLGRHIVLG